MLKNYLKIALKVLQRRKFFTFISLFGISFTLIVLMVATAMFDHEFGPLAPELKTDRMLGIYSVRIENSEKGHARTGASPYWFLERYVRPLTSAEKVSLFSMQRSVTSFKNQVKHTLYLKRTDGEFWEILDFKFLEGGPITRQDEKDANMVAVINEATRRLLFAGQSAVGKTIEADGQSFRVIGVVENVPIFRITSFSDVWVPLSTAKTSSYLHANAGEFFAIILAKSSDNIPKIKEELQGVLPTVQIPSPTEFDRVITAAETPFEALGRGLFAQDRDAGDYSAPLLAVLIALMLLFMLLPTLNLVNLNVSRIMERASEIGVRKAFGASSWRLVGQFVVENLVLTLIGGALALCGAWVVLRIINASGLVQYAVFEINYRIFFYGLVVALVFGLLSGVYPAWKMSRLHPVEALRGKSI
ncbi:ABC transporter permease [candidate division KSB1 bacterium]|nr:ABC transporter permease [candidate division KSB1 bacterium]